MVGPLALPGCPFYDFDHTNQNFVTTWPCSACCARLLEGYAEVCEVHISVSACARADAAQLGTGMDGMGSVLALDAPLYAPQAQLPSDCYHYDQAALAMGAAAAGQLDFGDAAPVYTSDGLFLPTKVCGRAALCMQELGSWVL